MRPLRIVSSCFALVSSLATSSLLAAPPPDGPPSPDTLSPSGRQSDPLEVPAQPGQTATQQPAPTVQTTKPPVLEVPAPADGVLAELVAADGATVTAEQVIARIDEVRAIALTSGRVSTWKIIPVRSSCIRPAASCFTKSAAAPRSSSPARPPSSVRSRHATN